MIRTFTAFFALFCLLAMPAQAGSDPALTAKKAENMVKTMGDEAISILESSKGDEAAIHDSFKTMLNKYFDMDTIARFAMGKYWSVATPEEQKHYTNLFKKMVVDVYSDRFSEYSGEKFEILGSKSAGRSDVVVTSQIIQNGPNPVPVEWRIRNNKVIDVTVASVSMSVTQRAEFAAIIQNGGGKVNALISHLEK